MAKMLYSVTMSLDGFIAGPAGDMWWMTEYLGPNQTVDDVIGQTVRAAGTRVRPGDRPIHRTKVKLERISLTHAPLATNLWLRVVR